MQRRILACLLLGLLSLCSASLASAQVRRQGFRLDRYSTPATAQDGFALTLPDVLPHLRAAAQLNTRYALEPLVIRTPAEHPIVQHRTTAELVGAVGLFNLLELYLRVPAVMSSSGEDATYELTRLTAPSGGALGDLSLGASLGHAVGRGFTVGVRAEAILPTGTMRSLTSDGAAEPRGEALVSYTAGRLTFVGSFGGMYRARRDYASVHVGSELFWGTGVRLKLEPSMEAWLEVVGARLLRERASEGASDGVELFAGARKRVEGPRITWTLGGALAAGLTDLAGEPAFRVMVQFGLARREPSTATGTLALVDSDLDGVPDDRDTCPGEPEDLDGFEDDDGCIDLDVDGDGVLDAADACPREAGPSRLGCPTDDLDEDGVPDRLDRCPRDAEDRDGDRDDDGCPDLDSDGDGLTDDRDACPDVRGLVEKQGCLQHAKLERDRIALLTPILFDTQNVSVAAVSAPVLDDVAALLAARPQLSALLMVHLVRRPVPDGGSTLAKAQAQLLMQALVARGAERARLHTQIELEAGGSDHVDIIVRAAPLSTPDAAPGRVR